MLGAIIGDIAGSRFEFCNYRSIDFELFNKDCEYTDDTIMTIAIADAILNKKEFKDTLRSYGLKYPFPTGGYGGSFAKWIKNTELGMYNSFGNGAAMRVSPCALLERNNREKALSLACKSAMPTHNHIEGIKGAMATVDAILMAFEKLPKEEIRIKIESFYGYDLSFTCNQIRKTNTFNETCQITVPQAIVAFLDSTDFENAIKLAISIGGDSDTIAAICGGIAEAYYGIPEHIKNKALRMLPKQFNDIITKMYKI